MKLEKFNEFLEKREHEVILFALCLVSLAFSFLNPLWYGQAPGFDASNFALIGKMWAYGEVLYRDMVDIKGPGIFFIDMVGYRLGGFQGIAFLENIFLMFGVISIDLALRSFRFSPLARFCSITCVISLVGYRYYYGNMTEDYALYLAMISSYPFSILFVKRRFYFWLSFVTALAFAFTLMIRLNNGSYFLAWYIMLCLYYANRGDIKSSIKLVGTVLLGLFIVCGSFALYFYLVGGSSLLLEAFYYSFLIFLQDGGAYGVHSFDFIMGTVGFFRTGLFIVITGLLLIIKNKDNTLFFRKNLEDCFWFVLYLGLGVCFTIVCNSVTGHNYDHYDLLYLPYMFIPLAFLMHRYLHIKQDIHVSFLTIFFFLIFLVVEHLIWKWTHHEWVLATVVKHLSVDVIVAGLVTYFLYILRKKIGFYYHNHSVFLLLSIGIALMLGINAITIGPSKGKPENEEVAQKVEIIKADTTPGDKIWVEGDMPQFYLWTDRNAASPYLFSRNVYPGFDVKQKIIDGLVYFKPKYIVVKDSLIDNFIKNESERMLELRYTRSEQAFYKFLFLNYNNVMPGLYRINSEPIDDDFREILNRILGKNYYLENSNLSNKENIDANSNENNSANNQNVIQENEAEKQFQKTEKKSEEIDQNESKTNEETKTVESENNIVNDDYKVDIKDVKPIEVLIKKEKERQEQLKNIENK
ncbi:MAG: hypothetical protein ACI4V7_07205 [Succinivibrionaceae bacterium]